MFNIGNHSRVGICLLKNATVQMVSSMELSAITRKCIREVRFPVFHGREFDCHCELIHVVIGSLVVRARS